MKGDERIRTAARALGTSYTPSGPGSRLGYVYFVQEYAMPDEPIKIGFSTDIAERVRLLRLKTGLHLAVRAYFPAQLQTERDLHKRFADHRIGNTEWFTPCTDLLDAIELVKALHGEEAA